MKITRHRLLLRTVWIAAVAVVIWATLLPSTSLAIRELALLHLNDKVEHFIAYVGLAFLPALHERRGVLAAAVLALVALGVALEFGQLHSFGRDFEVADMAADALGVMAGFLVALPVRRATE